MREGRDRNLYDLQNQTKAHHSLWSVILIKSEVGDTDDSLPTSHYFKKPNTPYAYASRKTKYLNTYL